MLFIVVDVGTIEREVRLGWGCHDVMGDGSTFCYFLSAGDRPLGSIFFHLNFFRAVARLEINIYLNA